LGKFWGERIDVFGVSGGLKKISKQTGEAHRAHAHSAAREKFTSSETNRQRVGFVEFHFANGLNLARKNSWANAL
jgi:hypothetical protein